MKRRIKAVALAVFAVVLSSSLLVLSQTRGRTEISPQHTWKLEDLYPSDQAWDDAKEKTVSKFDGVLSFKGKLGDSTSELLGCLELDSNISKELVHLHSYAAMKSDEDTRNSKYLALKQQIEQIIADYRAKASFIEPEITRMDTAKIDQFITQEPGLRIYEMYLKNIQRLKAHKLFEKEEKLLAEVSLLADSPHSIFSVFSNAELPFPQVTLSDGAIATLNQAGYAHYRASPNRDDREKVFQAFWTMFDNFKLTFGAQLDANIKRDIFYARARKYSSCLESAMAPDNIPKEVYLALIENVNRNLPTFHRYLDLKKRMLGVESLKYSDLYAPAVKDIDLRYTFDQAKELILDSLKPLGPDYCNAARQAFENRWIDVYPTPGKKMGAYSNGSAYDVHPYILLNYNGLYLDVTTLAHELGHAMHSYYSNKNQPFPTADYSIFVAEVASTFNEALLMEKMLSDTKDDETRLTLLMNYLDGAKTTFFRQTQFAEFELRIHEKAEHGEPLTGDVLSELYGDILKKYYGHEQDHCHIEDLYKIEWAYVPHFYYNFYVYQYVTSFAASTALVGKALSGEEGAVEKHIEFISSGGSDYPINLLRKAGVDMTSSEPFDKTISFINKVMDEIEAIL